jgi:hypothetical protein
MPFLSGFFLENKLKLLAECLILWWKFFDGDVAVPELNGKKFRNSSLNAPEGSIYTILKSKVDSTVQLMMESIWSQPNFIIQMQC